MEPKITVQYTIHPVTRYRLARNYSKTEGDKCEGGSESYGEFECQEQAELVMSLLKEVDANLAPEKLKELMDKAPLS